MIATAHQPMADLNRALASANDAEAIDSLLRAAEAGCVRAQTLLGWAYQNGQGVPVDYEQAAHWYRRAASHGDSCAMANLGVMSLLGHGPDAGDIEAFIWLQSAAGLGHRDLRPALSWLERRITSERSDGVSPAVLPESPPAHPCTMPVCDPSRCGAV